MCIFVVACLITLFAIFFRTFRVRRGTLMLLTTESCNLSHVKKLSSHEKNQKKFQFHVKEACDPFQQVRTARKIKTSHFLAKGAFTNYVFIFWHFLTIYVPSFHFLCSKLHVFLNTYPPLSANVI